MSFILNSYLIKVIFGLAVFMFLSFIANAQYIVSGVVTDQDGDALVSAIIIGKKSDKGMYPNVKGEFKLIVYPPDTIVVSAMGYDVKRIIILPDDSFLNKRLEIALTSKAYELGSVNIMAQRNFEEVKEDIKGLKPFEYQTKGFGAVASPVTYLYERFSRRVQSEKKVVELENEDLKRDALKDLLSQYVSKDILDLDAKEFDDFLNYCRLTNEFILNSSQYDLIMELKRSYGLYMRMKNRR